MRLPRKLKNEYQYPSPEYLKTLQDWYRQNWGEVFYSALPLDWTFQFLDPLLGRLKGKRARGSYGSGTYPLSIHRLEKDLVYLAALAIQKKALLFFSFPVSPVALGLLTIAYYANLPREGRDPFSTNHAISSKSFVIWIRPLNNGQIQNLKVMRTTDVQINLNERLVCQPAYRFDESTKESRLKVFTARSLSEGIELLKRSHYCSLVVLDDPSGRTSPSSYKYGDEAFELARLCKTKSVPLIGIVPPWTMKSIEYYERENRDGILFWAIDSAALCSYPIEPNPFANNEFPHPLEQSYCLLNQKRKFSTEPQVTIKTFSFETNDEEKIADAFQKSSDLLVDLSSRSELRKIWMRGWEIWRDLTAPVLPSYLLWDLFLQSSLKQLDSATQRCGALQDRLC